jgi:outer membrane lipoprotein carrier protein
MIYKKIALIALIMFGLYSCAKYPNVEKNASLEKKPIFPTTSPQKNAHDNLHHSTKPIKTAGAFSKNLGQVTVQAVPKKITQAPYLLLLIGKSEILTQLFSIAQFGNNHYRLTTKDKEPSFELPKIPYSHIHQTTKSIKRADAFSDAQQSFFQKIRDLKNLHATFTQRLNNPNQDLMQKSQSQGEIWITKPSFFKWVVSSPNQQTLVSDGKKLWIYDKELAQVTVQAVPDNITQAPYLLLLTGKPETLAQLFSIAQLNNNHYRLTPKDKKQSLMKYIDIVFKGKLLSKLVIQTDMSQSTDISFSEQSIAEIPLKTYQLGQLPGVAILDSTA